ncbi:MAG: hypothetical protein M3P06_20255, partial [Acidobacteriota bacterium]|nr:hypothetical protein [Acidobacteriota bacterium]
MVFGVTFSAVFHKLPQPHALANVHAARTVNVRNQFAWSASVEASRAVGSRRSAVEEKTNENQRSFVLLLR